MKHELIVGCCLMAALGAMAMERTEKLELARRMADGGIVLLQNEAHALPLAKGETIALVGMSGYFCHRMGWGSGDMMNHQPVQYDQGLERAGIKLDADFAAFYRQELAARMAKGLYDRVNLDWFKWTTRFDEPEALDKHFAELAKDKRMEKCVVVIGRNAGESDDLKDDFGSFRLHWQEDLLLKLACENFDTVIVLLNTCGVIDTSFMEKYPVKALVHTSLLGEVSGDAVADILTAKVNPSGKTVDTWAKRYCDYPTTDCFGTLDVPYREGVFVGYRFFSTYDVLPRYPFGHGLSYTTFALSREMPVQEGTRVKAKVTVKNTGKVAGREVVQGYFESDIVGEPALRLVAWRKTKLIEPGESETVELSFDLSAAAVYDDERAAWVLNKGDYCFFTGVSSVEGGRVLVGVPETIVFEQTVNRFPTVRDFRTLDGRDAPSKAHPYGGPILLVDPAPFTTVQAKTTVAAAEELPKPSRFVTLKDVLAGTATVEEVAAELTDDELGLIVNGRIFDEGFTVAGGTGVGGVKSGKIKNEAGEFWSSEKYALPVITCADGPSGVRLGNFGDPVTNFNPLCSEMVHWPSGTTLAQGWDEAIAEEFGRAVADDMAKSGIDGWLAPGINIHRNPLCGRNFEYFSEDPLVAGKMGAAIVRGVQTRADGSSSGRYATVKHFCTNDEEFQRGVEMNYVSERALREIYLKPFEIVVKEGRPHALMTSYNRLNGDYVATTRALVTDVLRGEWGFDGLVMTDWWNSADKLRHPYSGNDVVMPGVRKEAEAAIAAIKSGRIRRADAQAAAVNVLKTALLRMKAE